MSAGTVNSAAFLASAKLVTSVRLISFPAACQTISVTCPALKTALTSDTALSPGSAVLVVVSKLVISIL